MSKHILITGATSGFGLATARLFAAEGWHVAGTGRRKDRLDALHYAVDHAQEGDLIAVIGKGHETYRDREGVKTPFLERELLEEYAQQIGLE